MFLYFDDFLFICAFSTLETYPFICFFIVLSCVGFIPQIHYLQELHPHDPSVGGMDLDVIDEYLKEQTRQNLQTRTQEEHLLAG